MAPSLDSSIAYMIVGLITLSSFFFINWGFEVGEKCSVVSSECEPISYALVSWFYDLRTVGTSRAEALILTGWFIALFQIILSYAFYSGLYNTKEGFVEKYIPIGIILSLVLSVIGQIWWLFEVQNLGNKFYEINLGFGYYFLLAVSIMSIYFSFLGWQDKKLMMKSEDNLISYENSRERY